MGTVTLPVTLTANTNENVNDLNSNLNALTSALNGNIDETNAPNLTAAFTSYKRLVRASGQIVNGTGTLLMSVTPIISGGVSAPLVNVGQAVASDYLIDLDPAIYNANSRTTKLFIRYGIVVNNTAPAVNYTAGLYPIATYGGGASSPLIATVGSVVAGSTAVINAPGAGAYTRAAGSDFNFPAAGAYLLGVVPSGAAAANSIQHHILQLEMRQV